MKLPHRFSIAGLMAIVLIVAIALVALRSESAAWAGGVYLLTYGALLLAVVGAACRTGPERTWWLGSALFGIAYFRWSSSLGFRSLTLPTTLLLDLIRPAGVRPYGDLNIEPFGYYWLVGHCLWSLLAAAIGGGLALALFPAPKAGSAEPDVEARREARPARPRWPEAAAIGLVSCLPLAALALFGSLSNPPLWAGAMYLSTWLLIGTAILASVCGRGKRRMIWLGAALFGAGYMTLNRSGDGCEEFSYVHLAADEFLEAVRPKLPEVWRGFPAQTGAIAVENARIRKILDRKVPMRFREEASLERFLDHVRATTKAADGRELPIYVDPQGLLDADRTLESTIQIDLENISLGASLRLVLQQLSLIFYIRDGIVCITSTSTGDTSGNDYYLLVGHCCLAIISAGLGAFLVPVVAARDA